MESTFTFGALFKYTALLKTCWICVGDAGPSSCNCLELTLNGVTVREVFPTSTVSDSKQSRMQVENVVGTALGPNTGLMRPEKLRS